MLIISTTKMQIISSIAIVLSAVSALASGTEIRQVESDGSMLIDTSQSNYAITSPELNQQLKWRSVSINGNQITILTSTCQTIVKDSQSLGQAERALVTNIARRLIVADSIGNPNGSSINNPTVNGRRSAARFIISADGSMHLSRSQGSSMSSFQSNGLSVNKYDERNYSISKSVGLPNGIRGMFVSNGDLITYVYADGRVLMKPIACLDANENRLYQQIHSEVQRAQQQFEANMHQMQQNMANMFSNSGFPFNQAGFGAGFNPTAGPAAAAAAQAQAYAGPTFAGLNNHHYSSTNNNNQQSHAYASSGTGAASYVTPPPMNPLAAIAPLAPMQPMQPMIPMMPMNPFGNNFPFGNNNNPFGAGFPFNG